MGASSYLGLPVREEDLAPKGRSYGHEFPSCVCYAFPFHDT